MDRSGQPVAVITNELFHMSDTYVVDVRNETDVLCALIIVIAIDAEKCTAKKETIH